MPTHSAIEAFARESYGQAIAWLAARAQGDIAAAEDALSEGLLAALQRWPRDGVPKEPVAWLITAAKRRLIDAQRRTATRERYIEQVQALLEAPTESAAEDELLSLLFVCTHPAIDEAARAPLMLQTLMGLDAERIASVYLVSPATMSQRLVRAKARIKHAGIRFAVPSPEHWPERVESVLAAIYSAYTLGRDRHNEGDRGLSAEAVSLARMLVKLVPEEPEARGLLALCLHCEARHPAAWKDGAYVPLLEQNVTLWNSDLQREAEQHLRAASQNQRLGRYQLEAAIQSVHAGRRLSHNTNWPAIAALYQGLLQHTSALGAQIAHTIALSHVHGAEFALQQLDAISHDRVQSHQPWWAARAEFLAQLQRTAEAREAYQQAIGLSLSNEIRAFLMKRCERINPATRSSSTNKSP
jgi:RNA polymerase sigma-70 factor, ECF subfamily